MRPKIYLLGDSITEQSFTNGGWGSSLANYFARTADVVLRGYGGYNTRWALMAKHKVFPPGDAPLAVTVFLGTNDATIPGRDTGFLHVPIDEYKENLLAIVAFLKKQWPSTCVILITPPPVDEDTWVRHPYGDSSSEIPNNTNEAAGSYAAKCVAAAAECGVPVIDLWNIMQQNPDWKHAYLSDGLHLAPDGNKVVFEEVVKRLREEQISPETLPMDLPLFSEIDHNDPLKSFENL